MQQGGVSTKRVLRFWFKQTCALISMLLLLAITCIGMMGCTSDPTTNNPIPGQRVFRMNLGTEPPDLDPAKMTDLTSFTVAQCLMKGLTQFDAQAKVQPAVAKSWVRSADGLHYTFTLREDAGWSDGKPVKAQDFAYAWQRALEPKLGAEYAFFLYEIKNAKAYNEKTLTDFSQVGIRVVDDHTLQVTLERPTPFFLDLLASPIALPLRKELVESHPSDFTEAKYWLSNGAYQLKQWAHEERLVLTPNPHFYGKHDGVYPQLDRVDMLMVNDANTSVVMYENNELDFIETTTSIPAFDVRRLKNHPDAHIQPMHRLLYFGFNTQKPPFDNIKVRQAFAYALDRSYYPRLMQSGQKPLASWITPGLVGYNHDRGLWFDPKKARQLLAEAGYPNGKGLPPISLAFSTSYDVQKECEIAQFLWKKHLGVDVRLENMEWKVFLSRLGEDPPALYRLGWFVDYPDADSFMSMFIKGSGNNHTQWFNPNYDSLISEAVITLDPTRRAQLYDQAQRILLEQDTAIIPMYMAEKTYMVKPRVSGLTVNALNLINLDRLVVEKKAK